MNRSRLPWGGLLAVAACAVALAGCEPPASQSSGNGPTPSGAGNTAPSTGTGYKLAAVIPTFDHPFFVAMKKGLEEEAQAQGAQINVVDGKNKSQDQLSAMDNFVVQKVDSIILCPTESDALPPGVEKANGADIPVVTVNRTVSGGKVVTYVGADDTEGGRMQGKALMEALPKGGKIVLLQGVLNSSPQRNREAGLLEVLKGHPEYQIVDRFPTNFKRDEGHTAMQTVLLKYPVGKLDAVVAQSDDGAIAAADECKQNKRKDLIIIGFNGESDAFDYIKAGKIYATILQDAETQGREAVKAAIKHLKKEEVPNPQITELFTVTKKNINEHQPAWQSTKS